MAELRRVKPLGERCEAAEGRVQQADAEADALREMVANLTEGKVALTTKVCIPPLSQAEVIISSLLRSRRHCFIFSYHK